MTKNTKCLLFAFAGIITLVVAIFLSSKGMRQNFGTTVQVGNGSTTNQPVQKNDNTSGSGTDVVTSTKHGVFSGPAPYRNGEFGFEFTIPDGWRVIENPHASPYSYFNLTFLPIGERATYSDPVAINIVKPEFVKMSYSDLKPIDDTVVLDGVKGIKYRYVFEGGQNTDLVFPRKEDIFMIGFREGYNDIFNQVISSFKFVNRN